MPCIFIQTLINTRLISNNDKVLISPLENVLTLKFIDEGEEKVYDKKIEIDFSSNKTGMALKNYTQLREDELQTNNVLTI